MVNAVIQYWLTLVIPYDAENSLGQNVGNTLTLF
jgi:hypothetical protein